MCVLVRLPPRPATKMIRALHLLGNTMRPNGREGSSNPSWLSDAPSSLPWPPPSRSVPFTPPHSASRDAEEHVAHLTPAESVKRRRAVKRKVQRSDAAYAGPSAAEAVSVSPRTPAAKPRNRRKTASTLPPTPDSLPRHQGKRKRVPIVEIGPYESKHSGQIERIVAQSEKGVVERVGKIHLIQGLCKQSPCFMPRRSI